MTSQQQHLREGKKENNEQEIPMVPGQRPDGVVSRDGSVQHRYNTNVNNNPHQIDNRDNHHHFNHDNNLHDIDRASNHHNKSSRRNA
jgi:hypothetical protein